MLRLDITIRPLSNEDFVLYEKMETGLDDDYMLRVWERISSGEYNRLFGLFADGQLASIAGYTLYAEENAMLGRLRSDVRFRGKSFATKILQHVIQEALKEPKVKWISANTEEHNIPAQKVLKKLGLPHVITLYGALTQNLSSLKNTESKTWHKIEGIEEKKAWIEETYLNPSFPKTIFPFETHYPFPATPALFQDRFLEEWTFYENEDKTRYFIIWEEFKGNYYLNITYPWQDVAEQPGLWETVDSLYQELKSRHDNSFVWIDLTPEETKMLPEGHPFDLPSPWMLHGKSQEAFPAPEPSLEQSFQDAQASLEQVEKELNELNHLLDQKSEESDQLLERLKDLEEKN